MRDSIVVYRSPAEQWWWEHPEAQLWAFGILITIFIGIWIFSKIRRFK